MLWTVSFLVSFSKPQKLKWNQGESLLNHDHCGSQAFEADVPMCYTQISLFSNCSLWFPCFINFFIWNCFCCLFPKLSSFFVEGWGYQHLMWMEGAPTPSTPHWGGGCALSTACKMFCLNCIHKHGMLCGGWFHCFSLSSWSSVSFCS